MATLKNRWFDRYWIGVLIGIIAPMIGMTVFYFLRIYPTDYIFFLYTLLDQHRFLSAATSFSLMANAIVFTVFINRKEDKVAKGVFIVTCIIGIGALLLRIL
ncbi:MAG: hypothetical protein QM528_07720 [Phycisphaerales bacterium]|nr:hypothetical protein [Phycisphaerales bacterium]